MQSQDPLANRDPLANQDPVEGLVVSNISKHFGGVKALQNVRLEASFGTIHGLVGENGAGKSTIVKILSGRLAADSGSIAVRGRTLAVAPQRVDPGNVISTAYQELSVVPQWDVASNLLYCREPVVRFGRIGRRALRSQARDVLNALDVTWIDPTELVRNLSLADRQVLEIVRAIDTNAPVLLLDEPTSALPPERVAWFYDCIRRFLAPNNLVLFISHRLEEVRALCNWVTVLRNGSDVGTGPGLPA